MPGTVLGSEDRLVNDLGIFGLMEEQTLYALGYLSIRFLCIHFHFSPLPQTFKVWVRKPNITEVFPPPPPNCDIIDIQHCVSLRCDDLIYTYFAIYVYIKSSHRT